jgi:hypothetical protein
MIVRRLRRLLVYVFLFGYIAIGARAQTSPPRLENATLRIELSTADGSLTVLDKRDNLT